MKSILLSLLLSISVPTPLPWWKRTPEQARELINQRILMVEASAPAVGSISNLTITKDTRSTPIRIYSPDQRENRPIILMIHGGAWIAGNLDTHDHMARHLCSQTGALVVSVGYLNAPEGKFPTPLEQCYDALLWIREHGENYAADPAKIAVVGDSAGGNMAAALCLMARDRSGPKIEMQVLINPAPDLTCGGTLIEQGDDLDSLRWQAVQYLVNPSDANNPYVSPLVAADLSNLPPAMVILAEKDALREAGQKYADRLKASGVPTVVYCQQGVGHLAGDGARASLRAKESLEAATAALQNTLKRGCAES